MNSHFIKNDGGREKAGYKGDAGDCVCRAIAIATDEPYDSVYKTINKFAGKPVARTGLDKAITAKVMSHYGFAWKAVMKIGSGCTMNLTKEQVPSGVIIVKLTRHVCAVINGVIHDTHDCSRGGTRCVYGYWYKP